MNIDYQGDRQCVAWVKPAFFCTRNPERICDDSWALEPDKSTPLEQHEEEECWVILEGNGILLNERSQPVKKDEIFYFPSYQPILKAMQSHNPLLLQLVY